MHRKHVQQLHWLLCGLFVTSAGCRNPLADNQVQVRTNEPGLTSRFESPMARLGGTLGIPQKEKFPSAPGSTRSTTGNNLSAPADALSDASANKKGVSLSFGDQSADSTPLTPEEEELLAEAYANASPEIRELAKRQMAAVAKKETPVSTQSQKPSLPPAQPPADELLGEDEHIPSLDDEAPSSPANSLTQADQSPVRQANGADDTTSSSVTQTSASKSPLQSPEFVMPIPPAPATPTSESKSEPAADIAKAEPGVTSSSKESVSVASDSTATTTATTSVAANPADLSTLTESQLINELIARYQTKVDGASASDAPVHDVVALRTLHVIAGSPDAAVKPLANWKSTEQEFLNYQMLSLWQLLDPKSHPVRERRWAAALPDLRQATSHLAAASATLEVRNMAFCTEVLSYGQIKPFPNNRFQAGQLVILYMELENFVADRLTDGYETHFQGSYQIYDSTGKRVAHQILPADRQTCNNYRRDYFIPYEFHLPDKLAEGSYRLEVTMEDAKGKIYGQASIPFDITSTP